MGELTKKIDKAITKAVNKYLRKLTESDPTFKRTWKDEVKASVRIYGYDKTLEFYKSIEHRIKELYSVKPKTLFNYLEKFKKKNRTLDEFLEVKNK